MVFKDYYKILELKTNKVSSEEIKNAYRLAVKKNHPDLNIQDQLAEEKIKDINEAYKTLSDTGAKRKYDRIWTKNNIAKTQSKYREENKRSNSAFGEFFSIFFGNIEAREQKVKKSEKIPRKGENVETSINVELDEVFYGIDKKISLRTVDGKMKVFTVSIPAGIHNGEKIRLLGQGKSGLNGGKNGDLFIKVNINNNQVFKLNGNDLYTDLYLTPWEAALGTNTTVYSIDEGIKVAIPGGLGTGETIKIPGKGYKDGKGSRGDLIAKINIMVPKQLSKEEKKLFEKLSTVSSFNPRNK